MTPDTMQIQERIHLRNGAYTPWQPNGSNCGRVLDMITKSIYFPVADGEAVVLGGVPFAHLLENGRTALDNLRVPGGKVTIEVVKSAADSVVLTITGDSLAAMPTKVRFPAHLKVEAVRHAEAIADDCFALAADCRGAVFHLAEAK